MAKKLIKLNDGRVVYLEETIGKEVKEQADELAKQVPQGGIHPWRNLIVAIDWEKSLIDYYNSAGQFRRLSVRGWTPFGTDRDIQRAFERRIQSPPTSELKYLTYKWYRKGDLTKPFLDPNEEGIPLFEYISSEAFKTYVDKRVQDFEQRLLAPPYSRVRPSVHDLFTPQAYALLVVAQQLSTQYEAAVKRNREVQDRFKSVHKDIAPKVPFFPKEWKWFPHQAEALAALQMQDSVALDLSMGAGKTALLLADALLAIQRERAKRPLLIMPNNTLAQQKAEMERMTRGTVNIIVVNTQTANEHGISALEKLIKTSPPNTVILTSYEFISRDYEDVLSGVDRKGREEFERVFNKPNWFKSLGVDMASLDEVQRMKNQDSNVSKATMQFTSFTKIRRIASGTMVPNNPTDLVAPMSFLDSSILGGRDDFIKRYAKNVGMENTVTEWKEGAMPVVRKLLWDNGTLSMRRERWIHLLPEREEKTHYARFNETQQKVYKHILTEIVSEIMTDPKLADAWKKMQTSDDEQKKESALILAKFSRLDTFLNSPESDKLVSLLPEEDRVSPKLKIVDKLIDDHFSYPDPGKVIVFAGFKESVKAYMKYSKHQSHGLYYDASTPENLERFKNDPKIKILFAVDRSLREGHNLQVANRVIRVEVPYTPGDLEQSYGRVFRPKQKRKVYIDVVLMDGTFEITKFARLISKMHVNRQIETNFDTPSTLPLITLNLNNMNTFTRASFLSDHLKSYDDMKRKEIEDSKVWRARYGEEMVPLSTGESVKHSRKILVPRLSEDEEEGLETKKGERGRPKTRTTDETKSKDIPEEIHPDDYRDSVVLLKKFKDLPDEETPPKLWKRPKPPIHTIVAVDEKNLGKLNVKEIIPV